MQWTVRRGTQEQRVRFFIRRKEDGGALQGLTGSTPGIEAVFIRQGDEAPTELRLIDGGGSANRPGGFRELSDEMPGVYELHIPDEALAEGTETVVMLQTPGAEPVVLRFDLVAYDPYDGERLGLECLSQEGRHAVITRAFREVVPAIIREFQEEAERGSD